MDWAWFTIAKLGWIQTKLHTKHGSYNAYTLTHRRYIRIAQKETVKNYISKGKVNKKKNVRDPQDMINASLSS